MQKLCVFLATAVLFFSLGCGGPQLKAPMMPSGSRYQVAVLLDEGITAQHDQGQVNQLHQLGNWMEKPIRLCSPSVL